MNRERVPIDPLLWIIPLVMSGVGVLMVMSTTSPMSFDISGTPFTIGFRQLRWLLLGLVTMIVTLVVPMRFWFKTASFWWVLSVIMLILTLIPGVGVEVGGATRWLRIAGVSVQPSETVALTAVLLMAKYYVKNEMNVASATIKTGAFLVVVIPLLLLQNDFGSAALILLTCMGMYVERFGWKTPLLFGAACLAVLPAIIFMRPHRVRRFSAFTNPWDDPLGNGFQTIQGLIAFANGGAWGSGLGHGLQKLQYLPAAYTDYIFAALGEELGLWGTLGVLILCLMWSFRTRALYKLAPEGFETAVVWGITISIILPFFINIAGVTNMAPLTGIPLPFISYGGSSLLMMWARIGLLLRINREINMEVRA